MKIAFVGAGSYVFGPSVLAQIYLEEAWSGIDLALVDPDTETTELMAAVGRRMARERGLATTITVHAGRAEAALGGADAVVCSASPQMQRRFAVDWEIIDRLYPGHLKTEFGGVAGISYSLRQIAFIEGVAADMRRWCPDAWLLDVSNPLPRVCQAAQEAGIRTAGFCVVSITAYQLLWELMHPGELLSYPFAPARDAWEVVSAGVNHLAWVVEMRDRATGTDLLPALRERAAQPGVATANPRSLALLRETGYLLVPGDDHTRDFLPPVPAAPTIPAHEETPWHGSPDQRRQRLALLREVGAGERSWDSLLAGAAWEKPIRFLAAYHGASPPARFTAMNLVNDQAQIAALPAGVFVETPCEVAAGAAAPAPVALPDAAAPYCRRAAEESDAIVRAARERSRELTRRALELDPTVTDKAAGWAALEACLAAQEELVGVYE